MPRLIDLSQAEKSSDPFAFFYGENAVPLELAIELLIWFETSAPWHLTKASFYEQFEFSLLEAKLPSSIKPLCSTKTLLQLRHDVGKLFGASLIEEVEVTAHKLVRGQSIRIHNDFIAGRETHRLLLQFNREWSQEDGGLLMLFKSLEAESVQRIFPPLHRLAFGFAISPCSHHAVSSVKRGERFTLVYSFYEADSQS